MMMSDEEDEMYSYFLPHGIADDDLGDVHAPLPQHLHLDPTNHMQHTADDGDEMGHAAATAMSAAVGALGDGDEMGMGGYENLYYRNQALATRQPMISSMRLDSPSHVSRAPAPAPAPAPSPPSWQQEYANRKAIAAAAQAARLGGYAPPAQPPTLPSAASVATPTGSTSSYGTSAFGERRTSPPFFGGVTPSSTSTSSSASASSSISSQLLPQNLYYGHTPAPLTRAPSATSRLPVAPAPAAPTRPPGRGYGSKAGVLCRNGPHCNNPTCEYDHPDPQALALALAAQKLPLYEPPPPAVYRPTGTGTGPALNVDVVSTRNTSAPVFHVSTPTSAYGSEINESPASVMSDQTGFGTSFKDEDYAFPRSTSNATRPVGVPARTTSAGVAVGAVGVRAQRSVPSSPADVTIPRVTEANVAPAARKEIWPKATTTTTAAPSTPVIAPVAVPVAAPPVAVASKEVTSPPAAVAATATATAAVAATPVAAKEVATNRTTARPAGVTIIKRITATGTTIIPTSGNIAPVTIPRDVDESDSSESDSESETAPVVRVNQTLSQPDKKKPVTTNSVSVTTTTSHPAPEPEPTTAASPTVEESEDESSSSESEIGDDETRSAKGSDADRKPAATKRVSFNESKPVPAISNKKMKAVAREQAAREAAQAANATAGNASPASVTSTGSETPPSEEATATTPTTSDATTAATTAAHLSKKTKKLAAKELRRQQAAAAAASKKAQKNEKKEEKKEESPASSAPDVTAAPTTATPVPAPGPSPALSVVILTFLSSLRTRAIDAIDTDALRTWSGVAAHRSWSIATWCAGLALGLCWTLLCMIARVHKHAASVLTVDHHLAFCFTFLYVFPYLVNYVSYWAPPWAAPCLWYAFLMQVFCTQGSPILVAIFRVLLPLLFLTEGVAHHSFLLELNGAERLVVAFVLSAFRTQEYYRPTFLFSLSAQLLTALLYGANLIVQWAIFLIAILVIHTQDTQHLKRERDRVAADKKKGQQPPFTPAGVGIPGQAGYVPGVAAPGGVLPGAPLGGVAGNGLAAGVVGAGAVAGAAGGASPAGPATGGAYGSWPSVSGFSAADAAAAASCVPPTATAGAPAAAAATAASTPMSGLAGLLNRRRPKAGPQKSRRVSRW